MTHSKIQQMLSNYLIGGIYEQFVSIAFPVWSFWHNPNIYFFPESSFYLNFLFGDNDNR